MLDILSIHFHHLWLQFALYHMGQKAKKYVLQSLLTVMSRYKVGPANEMYSMRLESGREEDHPDSVLLLANAHSYQMGAFGTRGAGVGARLEAVGQLGWRKWFPAAS